MAASSFLYYQPDEVVGRAQVEATGGRPVLIPLVEGHSTTGTVHRAFERGITPRAAEPALAPHVAPVAPAPSVPTLRPRISFLDPFHYPSRRASMGQQHESVAPVPEHARRVTQNERTHELRITQVEQAPRRVRQ